MAFSLVDLLTPNREFSEVENKYLATIPKFTLEGLLDNTYSAKFEEYVNDQFVLRDRFIDLKSRCEFLLLKIENNGIIYGADGRMYQKLTTINEDRLERNLEFVRIFAEAVDTPVTFALVPDAFAVDPEYLPAGAPLIDEAAYLAHSYGQLGTADLRTMDLLPVMQAHNQAYIYYRTDHHWTTDGAYLFYREYMSRLGLTAVELTDLSPVYVPGFFGTHYNKAKSFNAVADTITYYPIDNVRLALNDQVYDNLYNQDAFAGHNKYAAFLYDNTGLAIVQNVEPVNGGRRLLLIKDSFANALVPFLTQNFDEIVVIDLRYFGQTTMSEYLADNAFDEILVMYGFSTFATDTNVARISY